MDPYIIVSAQGNTLSEVSESLSKQVNEYIEKGYWHNLKEEFC